MTFSNRWNRLVYAAWAPIYDLLMQFYPANRARAKAFEIIGAADAKSVLLVGAGTGADLRFFSTDADVTGVDLSPAMLRRAIRKAERLNIPFTPVCCDASELPFHDNKFDLVVLTLVVSVVPVPQKCLKESIRVLHPEGRMLVLDKFLPVETTPSVLRRSLNLITQFFGTDINRRWEQMSAGLPFETIDDTSSVRGLFRTLVIKKTTGRSAMDNES